MSYQIVDARYAEGKKVIQAKDSRDGYKGRASYLAEALGGRWVHRSGGYVISPAGAAKFEKLFAAGFDAISPIFKSNHFGLFYHQERGLKDLTAHAALKLAVTQ